MKELLTPQVLVILGAASMLFAVLGTAATAWVVVRLPADYFKDRERSAPNASLGVRVGKNLLGCCALVLGLLMVLPGVPGPGLITMLLGIVLLDFPGKYAAERWLVRLKVVHRWIDGLRVRFGRAPLELP